MAIKRVGSRAGRSLYIYMTPSRPDTQKHQNKQVTTLTF
jgi:hypothetical protein